jgi:hemerythrin-like domain-containing protein
MTDNVAAIEDWRMSAGLPREARWKLGQSLQLRLCDELEEIADSLPSNIDHANCLRAARGLGNLIKEIHSFEEDSFFPEARSVAANEDELIATIERLKLEHMTDESYAEDLVERLKYLSAGGTDLNMETTGYMLRGFFEALRRHVAFEQSFFAAASGSHGVLH